MQFSKIILSSIGLHCVTAGSLRGDSPQRDLGTVLYYPKRVGDGSQSYCAANLKGSQEMGYATELACCKAYFPDQASGKCLSMLPAPPTVSPTGSDGPDAWYSNYADFKIGKCINKAPVPNGRTVYDTQLECCKSYYATQTTGACLADLPDPPTVSPTPDGGVDVWYKNPDVGDWTKGYCINKLPTPNGATTYDSELECCKGAYAGQASGKCLSMLPAPPTVSPTPDGGVDEWYADFDLDWADGKCINKLPQPTGRLIYDSQLECCKGAYAGQASGACLADLPSPPTVSPTGIDGPDAWYSNYADFKIGKCINKAPVPNGRTVYDTQLECCKGFYATQESGACLADLPNPPTVSPTPDGGVDEWYPDYDLDWADGKCINKLPRPSGRTVYDSQLECCKGSYAAQESGTCLKDLPNPPTVSPTGIDGPDAWYSNYADFGKGKCINTAPVPNGRTVYDTQLECCKSYYATQTTGACLADLPDPPTVSPTPDGGVDIWYKAPDVDWTVGYCINKLPTPNGATTYDSELECCKGAYAGQSSGKCLSMLPNPPTVSPTGVDGPDAWYSNNAEWSKGKCINKAPVPNGRLVYDTQLECCKGVYATQESGACLADLPSPPTSSPVGSDAVFFPIWSSWTTGYCDNDPAKRTPGNKSYNFNTQAECCEAWYPNQPSGACMRYDPTYGSRSPTQAPIQ